MILLAGLLFLFVCNTPLLNNFVIIIKDNEAKKIGTQIWKNEGAQKKENLIVWRENEPCLSLGIFHFIWYPKNAAKPHIYKETFRSVLQFMRQHAKPLPSGIVNDLHFSCPWADREAFIGEGNSIKKQLLVDYLLDTIELQTEFIITRLKKSIPHILDSIKDKKKRVQIEKTVQKLLQTTQGKYVLVDYLNFKGEGTKASEGYGATRWGLLQVLEGMDVEATDTIAEFALSANKVLEKRVENAPTDKKASEQKWLAGWKNRIKTYTQPI